MHRLPALDGTRAIAVLAVVALHARVLPWGWVGVDLFFTLSGFLITGILLDAKDAGGARWATYAKPFYMRRLLRIVPLAWAFLALLFLVAPVLGIVRPVPFAEQIWYWGFLSNAWLGFRSATAWMAAHFWSLAVEEQFYLVWPWLVLALPRPWLVRVLKTLLVLAIVSRIAIVLLHLPPQIGHTYENFTVTRMDGLVAGSLVALCARAEGGLARYMRRAIGWLIACGALFVLLQIYAPTKQLGYVFRYAALAGCTASALLLILSSPTSPVSRLLGARWLTWIGARSYAVYVIHLPIVLWLAARALAPLAVLAAGLGITLALAAVSWAVLESPFLAMKSRWPMMGSDARTQAPAFGAVEVRYKSLGAA
jgi:peptidoglycan/LPS O-acetylase OafA/YrhL